MRRLFTVAAVAAALSIPASVAAVGVMNAGPAFASSSITCASLKGNIASTITIGKCTLSGGKGYKSASALATVLVLPQQAAISHEDDVVLFDFQRPVRVVNGRAEIGRIDLLGVEGAAIEVRVIIVRVDRQYLLEQPQGLAGIIFEVKSLNRLA